MSLAARKVGVRPAVTLVAGNDASQMLGAWMCWNRWCWEEFGRELDHGAWLADQATRDNRIQIVAWDGAEPVGMVEATIVYDPMRRAQIAHGDKAYVMPAYRKTGACRGLVQAVIDLSDLLGVKYVGAPVSAGPDATAPWLRSMYDELGFEVIGISMIRDGGTR